jgi:glutamate--cysteine ligase
MLDLASEGLKRRACLDNAGSDETGFLTPLRGVVQSGRTLSEELLDAFNGRWSKTVDPLFGEFSY